MFSSFSGVMQHAVDQLDDVCHLVLLHAARGDGGVPKRSPDVRNGERESNGTMFLLVVMSAATRQRSASLPVSSGELRAQVDQHEVVVRTARNDLVAALDECLGHSLGVLLHLQLVLPVLGLQRLAERYGALAAITCSSGPPVCRGIRPS